MIDEIEKTTTVSTLADDELAVIPPEPDEDDEGAGEEEDVADDDAGDGEPEELPEEPAPFDLDAAVAAYIAERDQQMAAKREEKAREEREIVEQECSRLWKRVTVALPDEEVRAAFGITGATWDRKQTGAPEVSAKCAGHEFRISSGGPTALWIHAAATTAGYSRYEQRVDAAGSGWLLGALLATVVWQREMNAAEEAETRARAEVAEAAQRAFATTAPGAATGSATQTTGAQAIAKTWEPQVLGSDGFRTTYLLDVKRGCGSLTQHELVLAEISASGDAILSTAYFGRANQTDYDENGNEHRAQAIVERRMSADELRALWPLWQQMTAKAEAKEAEAKEAEAKEAEAKEAEAKEAEAKEAEAKAFEEMPF